MDEISPGMRTSFAALLVSLFIPLLSSTGACQSEPAVLTQASEIAKPGILVELFTSEGCSSCPPADALLRQLDAQSALKDVQIVVLGEHVDYWDGDGWHDRFSSHEYTVRQQDYAWHFHIAGPYTPQIVVDGRREFVGNDASALRSALVQAALEKKALIRLTVGYMKTQELQLQIETNLLPAGSKAADLYVGIADNADETQVRGGENSGTSLKHVAVLRRLQRVGKLDPRGSQKEVTIQIPNSLKKEDLRVVAFVQESGNGNVLGSTVKILSQSPATQ